MAVLLQVNTFAVNIHVFMVKCRNILTVYEVTHISALLIWLMQDIDEHRFTPSHGSISLHELICEILYLSAVCSPVVLLSSTLLRFLLLSVASFTCRMTVDLGF